MLDWIRINSIERCSPAELLVCLHTSPPPSPHRSEESPFPCLQLSSPVWHLTIPYPWDKWWTRINQESELLVVEMNINNWLCWLLCDPYWKSVCSVWEIAIIFIFTFPSGNKAHTVAVIGLSIFRTTHYFCFYEILMWTFICGKRKCAYTLIHTYRRYIDRRRYLYLLYLCIYVSPSHPFTANANYFRDEEMKCYFWRKDWSFIRIVRKMTQPATHSDFKAFKCCFVPKLTSIQSSSSKTEWAFLSQKTRLHQHHCPCILPASARLFKTGSPIMFLKRCFADI